MDELTLTLPRKIRDEARAAAGDAYARTRPTPCIDRMIDEFGRKGRSGGAGFYEYDETASADRLWPGLREELGATAPTCRSRTCQERMLFAEAIETVKCLDEGVLTSVADANIGSILGHRFPGVDRRCGAVRRGFPGRRGRVRGPRRRARGAVRRAVPGSGVAAGPRRRLIRPPASDADQV